MPQDIFCRYFCTPLRMRGGEARGTWGCKNKWLFSGNLEAYRDEEEWVQRTMTNWTHPAVLKMLFASLSKNGVLSHGEEKRNNYLPFCAIYGSSSHLLSVGCMYLKDQVDLWFLHRYWPQRNFRIFSSGLDLHSPYNSHQPPVATECLKCA